MSGSKNEMLYRVSSVPGEASMRRLCPAPWKASSCAISEIVSPNELGRFATSKLPLRSRIAPTIFGRRVHVPPPGEYVARGAARQAAWVHAGAAEPPEWELAGAGVEEADEVPAVRERYRAARESVLDRLPH